MQVWNPKSLRSFHSVRFHICGFFPACISKPSKAWLYFLGMWVQEKMMRKIPPLFCRLTSWAQWHLFRVCSVTGDPYAWPWWSSSAFPDGCCLRIWAKIYPEHRKTHLTQLWGSYIQLPQVFWLHFFSLRLSVFCSCSV